MTDRTSIYTHTDEAPALATYSLLPIVRAYAARAGLDVETRDISLAGRIIASFPEYLEERQRCADALGLGPRPLTAVDLRLLDPVPQGLRADAELQADSRYTPWRWPVSSMVS